MMANPGAIGSPLWWLLRLERRLRMRTYRTNIYDDYYSGNHRLAFATPKFREAFGGLFNELADDWTQLVVDAVDERMHVTGFRIGADSDQGDKDAWRIWQANQMDAGSRMAHVEALVREEAAAIVWFGDASTNGEPKITIEAPTQVIVEFADSSRTTRAAALKLWLDDDGYEYATVYLPDAIYKYRSSSAAVATQLTQDAIAEVTDAPTGGSHGYATPWRSPLQYGAQPGAWVPRESATEPWPLPNPLKVVPVVPLTNRPRLGRDGESEIRKVIPVQDAVNKMIADLLVASEYQSFNQRVLIGWDVPKDAQGNVINDAAAAQAFQQSVSRILTTENPNAKVAEFQRLDLTGHIKAVEMFVQHIASQTRTPPHYFYLSGNFPSGESIKSAETGLVSKAKTKMLHFGESWEEVIRLAFAVKNDPRAGEVASETIWANPETMSESEHIDATIKKLALGIPVRQLQEDAGYSPAQIERFPGMLEEQARLYAQLQDLITKLAPVLAPNTGVGDQAQGAAGITRMSPEIVPGAPLQPEITAARNPI